MAQSVQVLVTCMFGFYEKSAIRWRNKSKSMMQREGKMVPTAGPTCLLTVLFFQMASAVMDLLCSAINSKNVPFYSPVLYWYVLLYESLAWHHCFLVFVIRFWSMYRAVLIVMFWQKRITICSNHQESRTDFRWLLFKKICFCEFHFDFCPVCSCLYKNYHFESVQPHY